MLQLRHKRCQNGWRNWQTSASCRNTRWMFNHEYFFRRPPQPLSVFEAIRFAYTVDVAALQLNLEWHYKNDNFIVRALCRSGPIRKNVNGKWTAVTIYRQLNTGFVATFVFCLICLTIYAIK